MNIKSSTKLLAVFLVLCILLLPVSTAFAETPPPQDFYFTKQCDLTTPGVCTIIDSSLVVLIGATILYDNHAYFTNPDGIAHQAATILVTTADEGGTAIGHVSWVRKNGEWSGIFTIEQGTGTLAGLHANGSIFFLSYVPPLMTFSMEGTCFFAP